MKKNKALICITVIGAFFLFTVIVAAKQYQADRMETPLVETAKSLSPGMRAPLFRIESIAGQNISLDEYISKKPVLLFFWSFFSSPCRKDIPFISQISNQYQDRGLAVMAINLDGKEMRRVLQRLREKEKIDCPIAIDELKENSFSVAGPYGVADVPSLFLINSKGTISYVKAGALDPMELHTEIGRVIQVPN